MADYWYWMIAVAVFLVLEILTPGVFFMWIGIAAFITGIVDLAAPETTPAVLGMIFAVLAVISACVGRKLMKKEQNVPSTLNNRAEQYVGQVFQVYEAVTDGRGKIKVGDTVWAVVADKDIPADTSVRVVSVKGTALAVEPASDDAL